MTQQETTDIMVALARLEGKVDVLCASRGDHELRLRSLEKARWVLAGAAASAGYAGAWLKEIL